MRPGLVAAATNSTPAKSSGRPTKRSRNARLPAGSSAPSKASAAASPCRSSSPSSTSGLSSTRRAGGPSRPRASTRRPGAASAAGLATPWIDAGFSAPARETRTKRRPSATASARVNAAPPDAGRPAETLDRGRRGVGAGPVSLGGGLTGHQVVERWSFSRARPTCSRSSVRRSGATGRRAVPPPAATGFLLPPRSMPARRRPRGRRDAGPGRGRALARARPVRGRAASRTGAASRISPHGEAATSRVEARVLVCVGDDGDRGGVGGFYPAKGQELADRAQLPREFPDPRLAGMAPDYFPTSP